jgi:small-conductance mechanosensitive channel
MTSLAVALAALAGAILVHLAVRRGRQQVAGRIMRRRRSELGASSLRAVSVGLLAVQVATWLVALRLASGAHPALARARDDALSFLTRAFESPLFALSGRPITALDLVLLPVAAFLLWLAISGTTQLARALLLSDLGLDGGSEETVVSLLRYVLGFLGALIALQVAGVDVRALAIAGGVLGVGIGFGLQHLANNFVSGIVIGLERPVRPGDFVRVGEHLGTVLRIGARSTALRTRDRVTILIPNSRFLETDVMNWSHGDPLSRVHVPIGVDYGSDVSEVRAALLAAARAHPAVLREPRPQVQLRAFGGSSLEFELLVWTRDPTNQHNLVSDLNFGIVAEFDRNGIKVPFPQLDVHLRTTAARGAHAAAAPEPGAGAAEAVGSTAEARPGAALGSRYAVPRKERSPEDWTVLELEEAAERMRGPDGVRRSDRRHWLRVYRDCFVGSQAVNWMVEHEGLTRSEACVLGERLTQVGLVRHVLDEHGFLDRNYYYRFDSPAPRSSA